jgi:hypothetical protein
LLFELPDFLELLPVLLDPDPPAPAEAPPSSARTTWLARTSAETNPNTIPLRDFAIQSSPSMKCEIRTNR